MGVQSNAGTPVYCLSLFRPKLKLPAAKILRQTPTSLRPLLLRRSVLKLEAHETETHCHSLNCQIRVTSKLLVVYIQHKSRTVESISSKYANFVSTSLVSMDCAGQCSRRLQSYEHIFSLHIKMFLATVHGSKKLVHPSQGLAGSPRHIWLPRPACNMPATQQINIYIFQRQLQSSTT